jgi:Flp pilus assembly protein TadG
VTRQRRHACQLGLRAEQGALTLGYVIIVPAFLAAIMVIVQASVWYLARETAIAAARQGADVARTAHPPPGQGIAAAIIFASQAAPGFLMRPSASAAGSSAQTVQITVSGRVPSLVPGMVITVREVVTAPVERFTAAGPRRAGVETGSAEPLGAPYRALAGGRDG